MRKGKRDFLETRIKNLEGRKAQVKQADDELANTIRRMSVEQLVKILLFGYSPSTDAERQQIRRLAEWIQKNPTSPVSPEFMNLPFVSAYMEKKIRLIDTTPG